MEKLLKLILGPSEVDGLIMLSHALDHITREYTSTASFQARGHFTPWQQEATGILLDKMNEVTR